MYILYGNSTHTHTHTHTLGGEKEKNCYRRKRRKMSDAFKIKANARIINETINHH
jgi:hypothetical protein